MTKERKPRRPRISVITPLAPTGMPYIQEAWESLRDQEGAPAWEWVLLPNGGAQVPGNISSDRRVRVYDGSDHTGNIGRLKREACAAARGDILVELDHDDILMPDALAAINAHVRHGAEMVYSDFAEFKDGTFEPNHYSGAYGWKIGQAVKYNGRVFVPMIAPPVTPQNMRLIEWAPNHVRAWTAASYSYVGGHDATMRVGDDFDLTTRYYLSGRKIERIPECLYLYRVHPGQTVAMRNPEIREASTAIYNRSVWKLAEKFAADEGLMKVDLGGAIDPPAGYTTLDRGAGADIATDLDARWPLKDGSVGVIRAHDILEHLHDPIHAMNEAYRVLAPGGWLMIQVPSALGQGAFQDPTHCSFWVPNSFWYYTDRKYSRYIPAFMGRFQKSRVQQFFPSDFHRENNIPYVEAHLIALKDGYEPMGEVLI